MHDLMKELFQLAFAGNEGKNEKPLSVFLSETEHDNLRNPSRQRYHYTNLLNGNDPRVPSDCQLARRNLLHGARIYSFTRQGHVDEKLNWI